MELGRGPSNDAAYFPQTIRQAAKRVKPVGLLADAAYDAEPFHRLCREELGIPKTMIPLNFRGGNPRIAPQTPYRKEMYDDFQPPYYGQRTHGECVVSQIKRRLGPTLNARSHRARQWESQLKFITFNTLLLAQNAN